MSVHTIIFIKYLIQNDVPFVAFKIIQLELSSMHKELMVVVLGRLKDDCCQKKSLVDLKWKVINPTFNIRYLILQRLDLLQSRVAEYQVAQFSMRMMMLSLLVRRFQF